MKRINFTNLSRSQKYKVRNEYIRCRMSNNNSSPDESESDAESNGDFVDENPEANIPYAERNIDNRKSIYIKNKYFKFSLPGLCPLHIQPRAPFD